MEEKQSVDQRGEGLVDRLAHSLWRMLRPEKRHGRKPQVVPGDMNAPWEEFPEYSAVTSGWRQGNGEVYLLNWAGWYASKTPDERASYRARHSAPEEWDWFYDSREPSTP